MVEDTAVPPCASVEVRSLAALKTLANTGEYVSEWAVIDQAMIDGFAHVTGDNQWIHTDVERAAKESPFGGTIAHGFLTLSMVPALFTQLFTFPNREISLNYGFDKIRFTYPVKSGSRVRSAFRLQHIEDVGANQARCEFAVRVEIEGVEKPALVATWLLQMGY